MGPLAWFGKKKQPKEQAAMDSRDSPTATISSPAAAGDIQQAEGGSQSLLPGVPAVFEFGGPAKDLQMRGICEVDDPDQIQACVWQVVHVDAEAGKLRPKYEIAF